MKVSWDRASLPTLTFPPVCPVTGEPTVGTVRLLFRKGWMPFVPRSVRAVTGLQDRPVSLLVPVSDRVLRYVRRRRRALAAVGLGSVAVALVGTVVGSRSERAGLAVQLVASLGILAFLVLLGVFTVQLDVLGSDVDGHRITITRAHPDFVPAFVAANPLGTVQVHDLPPLPGLVPEPPP